MNNFEAYKRIMLDRGYIADHEINTPIKVNDFISDDAFIEIPKNPTVFHDKTGVEFIACLDVNENRLVRFYLCWFNNATGDAVDELQETGSIKEFLLDNVGNFLHITCNKDGSRIIELYV